MDYLTIEQARERDGLQLVLTSGAPGPWSVAAEKNPMFNGYRYNPKRVEEVRSTSRDFLDFQR